VLANVDGLGDRGQVLSQPGPLAAAPEPAASEIIAAVRAALAQLWAL
jgi:hypothetical protein